MGKIVLLDVDGTLVDYSGKLPESARDAVREARKNGHLVFICTGRSEYIVEKNISEIGFDGGIYSAGGKVVYQDQIIYEHVMSQDVVFQIREILDKEPTVFYLLESSRCNFKGNMKDMDFDQAGKKGMSTEFLRMMSVIFQSNQPYMDAYQGESVYKISFFSSDMEAMDRVVKKLNSLGKVVTFENMNPGMAMKSGEISDWSINKGTALQAICQKLGKNVEDCIAFGDSMNDMEALIAAGIGVAMGNAESRVKDIADIICESVEEDCELPVFLHLKDSITSQKSIFSRK